MQHYECTWQTWDLVSVTVRPNDLSHRNTHNDPLHRDAANPDDWRTRVQRNRIERRYTVHDVAQEIGCDPKTFAAFERGDDVLTAKEQAHIKRFLDV